MNCAPRLQVANAGPNSLGGDSRRSPHRPSAIPVFPYAPRVAAFGDQVRPWAFRRLFAILASFGLVVIGIVTTTGGAELLGHGQWGLPNDLWATLVASERLLHGDLAHLYTSPTALVAPPGTALLLVPAALVVMGAGLTPGPPVTHSPTPSAWWAAGTYEIVVSCVVLFAVDTVAERMGVSRGRRAVLALAEAIALWNVSVRWGHPEDAVAVALLLYAVVAVADGRNERSAWLLGFGLAVQPLIVLALPVVAAAVPARRVVGYVGRALVPAVVVLVPAVLANARATVHAVTEQPNYPEVDHPTPWVHLAPRLGSGVVAAGPGRIAAIAVACLCGLYLAGRPRPPGRWTEAELGGLVWWVTVALALRVGFESVMVAYYLWPPIALALVASSPRWWRLLVTSVLAGTLTFVSQVGWRGDFAWWLPMTVGVAVLVALARTPADRPPPLHSDQGNQDTWPCSAMYPTKAAVSMSVWAITRRGSRR
jgi:hypothetical protein